MRTLGVSIVLIIVATVAVMRGRLSAFQAATSTPSMAQAAPADTAAMKKYASAADVQALMAKARAERKEGQASSGGHILALAPYNINLESGQSTGLHRFMRRRQS